jgi:hypothetical protein
MAAGRALRKLRLQFLRAVQRHSGSQQRVRGRTMYRVPLIHVHGHHCAQSWRFFGPFEYHLTVSAFPLLLLLLLGDGFTEGLISGQRQRLWAPVRHHSRMHLYNENYEMWLPSPAWHCKFAGYFLKCFFIIISCQIQIRKDFAGVP